MEFIWMLFLEFSLFFKHNTHTKKIFFIFYSFWLFIQPANSDKLFLSPTLCNLISNDPIMEQNTIIRIVFSNNNFCIIVKLLYKCMPMICSPFITHNLSFSNWIKRFYSYHLWKVNKSKLKMSLPKRYKDHWCRWHRADLVSARTANKQ